MLYLSVSKSVDIFVSKENLTGITVGISPNLMHVPLCVLIVGITFKLDKRIQLNVSIADTNILDLQLSEDAGVLGSAD